MKVFIPENFLPERQYIVEILIKDFLNIDAEITIWEKKYYEILLENKNKIIIKDAFWINFDEQQGYLSEKNIPEKIFFAENSFTKEKNIPVIYGNSEFQVSENQIICGIDIFASSFFMLTRWEEYVSAKKDKHGRFPDKMSLVQKNNVHYRPIVDEYTELLRRMIEKLSNKSIPALQKFKIIPTHDIDFLFKFDKFSGFAKNIAGDLLKRQKPAEAIRTTKKYWQYKTAKTLDPYDTFDFLMNISEKNNTKSHFYFIAGQMGETDVRYNFLSDKTRTVLQKIRQRNHIIGIHGSYDSFDNSKIFQKELNRFKQQGIEVNEGRQHYLRFANPHTWRIWNKNNIKIDSTMGFANDGGFRSGTCHEYKIFDILERKKLALSEMPLIAMETALRFKYENKKEFYDIFLSLRDTVKKYNGNFVFLWHQSNFNTFLWRDFIDFYPEIFE